MLDIKYIRQNSDLVKEAAKNKLINIDIDRLLELDESMRAINQELDALKEERNKLSSSIPTLSNEDKKKTIEYVKELKEKIPDIDEAIFRSIHNVNMNTMIGYRKDGETHLFTEEYKK